MNYTINFTNDPSTQELEIICKGLDRHAEQTIGSKYFKPFGFLVHDNSEILIAGCTGVLMYGVLYIKSLWVDEIARGKGIGQELIKKAELSAKEHKCPISL